MTRKKRSKRKIEEPGGVSSPDPLDRFDRDLPACDRDTFVFAYVASDAAMSGRTPPGVVPSSVGRPVAQLRRGDKVQQLVLGNHPMIHMMDAVKDAVGGDIDATYVHGIRISAVHQLLRDGVLDPFMRKTPDGGTEINGAVLYVAAEAPCNAARGFEKEDFVRRVREMIVASERE